MESITCAWGIVISPMIPQDFPPCYYSSMRNLRVEESKHRRIGASISKKIPNLSISGPSFDIQVEELRQALS